MSQKILQYVEIDVDYCSLTYGVEPCQAKVEPDPVSNTKLLLHLDFVEFYDSSPVQRGRGTPNGGVTISTAQSKFGGASALFDGINDYIQFANSADFVAGRDFTVDCWVRLSSFAVSSPPGASCIAGSYGGTGNYWLLYIAYDGSVTFYTAVGGVFYLTNGTGTVSLNTWTHIAVVRSEGVARIYIDGVGGTEQNTHPNVPDSTGPLQIGIWSTTGFPFNGYIDELRISNSARWTSNFTPPSSAYAQEDPSLYNKLLLHFEGVQGSTVITDSSPAAHGNATHNVAGAGIVNNIKKFGDGSVYFPATNAYFTFPDSEDWDFGPLDFTVDWWEYRFDITNGAAILQRQDDTSFQAFLLGHANTSTGNLEVYMSSNGSSWDIALSKSLGTAVASVWNHYAVVRNGSTFYAFKNGVQTDTWTSSSTLLASSGTLKFGRWAANLNAVIDEFRISKGVARWTSNFTPPTTSDRPNTGAIKCFNTIVTCQDRVHFSNSPVTLRFAVPTADLPTDVECIPNIKSIAFDPATVSLGQNLGQRATLTITFDDHRHSDTGQGFDKYLADRTYNPYKQGTFWGKFRSRQPFVRGRPLRWIVGDTDQDFSAMETRHYIIDSFTGPDNNGVFRLIAKDLLKLADGDRALAPPVSEGFLVADITNSATTLTLSPSGIAANYPNSGYANIGGTEIVSYTHSGIDASTFLLLHCDGTDASTTFTDSSPYGFTVTANGNAQIDTAQLKFGSASGLFDGTGDYLTVPNNEAWEFGSGDFTIDWWERRSSATASRTSMARDSTTNFVPWILGYSDGTNLRFYATSNGASWDLAEGVDMGTIELNVWHHFAVVRSSNVFFLFKDGVIQSSFVSDKSFAANSNALSIGRAQTTAEYAGWLDEIRISKGVARWKSPFIPPAIAYAATTDTLTIARAQLGTSASAHSTQDRVQFCLRYAGVTPDRIIFDLLRNYANADAIYLPLNDWHQEIISYLNRSYTGTLAQPLAVNTLISELIEQAGLSMWWDDRDQEVGMLVLRGLIYSNDFFDDNNMIAETLQVTEQPDKRLSQVHTYFGQINPITSLTDKANYRSVSKISNAQSEIDYGSAAIKEIFSRWIPNLGRSVADRLGNILISRFKDPPRKFGFSLLRNSTAEVVLANGYQLSSWPIQDETGANDTVNVQVTRMRPNADLIELEAEEVIYPVTAAEDLTIRNLIVDANTLNLNLRDAHDLIYPSPTAGITVILTINSGVKVGSTINSLNSVVIGDWPVGVTIIVNVVGRIQGKGGGGWSYNGNEGQSGGPALYTRYAINLACPVGGQIWGGGGGGGGASYNDGSNGYYWGGGGGAGFNVGIGGGDALAAGSGKGQDGTTEAGGAGSGYAGAGGGPGANGANGTVGGTAGGAAGYAIDGASFVTKGTWNGTTFTPTGSVAGSILGSQVN